MRKGGNKAAVAAPYGLQQPSGATPTELMPEEIFKHCETEKFLHAALKYITTSFEFIYRARYLWNSELWIRCFHEFIKRNKNMLLAMRKLVQIVLRGRYFLPNGTSVVLDKKELQRAANRTVCYPTDYVFPSFPPSRTSATPVIIINGDCIATALWLQTKGLRTAVLNMASASHPGGGYIAGRGAQEENLHRRTNLFQCLHDPYLTQTARAWSYPLPEFGGVFSPQVTVLRHAENKGYSWLEMPEHTSFISAYAYAHPPVETNAAGELRLGKSIANHMRRKIEAIFNIAVQNNIECLVLGALGCGAYSNPPKHVAQLFQEVLRSKFSQHLALVVFGILDDHNAHKEHNPEGNIKPFADVFTPHQPVPTLLEAMLANNLPIAESPQKPAAVPARTPPPLKQAAQKPAAAESSEVAESVDVDVDVDDMDSTKGD